MTALAGLVVGLLERRHADPRGSLILDLVPALGRRGAHVRLVHPDEGMHRLDRPVGWDVTVLKSGSGAALHLAAAGAGLGVPSVNDPEATRLAQDRLASAAILARAGLPIPPARLAWLGGGHGSANGVGPRAADLDGTRPVIIKAQRGSQGAGLWHAEPGELARLAPSLPPGPYLVMTRVPREGDDLKLFVAGAWMQAIHRRFPARTLDEKRGRPAAIPAEVREMAARAGAALGLRCFGCDFVRSPEGWHLVDVNAFPGYKGADGAADAIADEIERTAAERVEA